MSEQITAPEWLDGAPPPGAPDPHGEAALMLVESLIHALVARGGLSLAEAIEVTDIASDAQTEICGERGEMAENRQAVRYLSAIAESLRVDTKREPSADSGTDGHGWDASHVAVQPGDGR